MDGGRRKEMDGIWRKGGWMEGWRDRWLAIQMKEWMAGWCLERTDGQMDRDIRLYGKADDDKWMDTY